MLKAFGELSVFNTDIANFPVTISVELLGCHRNWKTMMDLTACFQYQIE